MAAGKLVVEGGLLHLQTTRYYEELLGVARPRRHHEHRHVFEVVPLAQDVPLPPVARRLANQRRRAPVPEEGEALNPEQELAGAPAPAARSRSSSQSSGSSSSGSRPSSSSSTSTSSSTSSSSSSSSTSSNAGPAQAAVAAQEVGVGDQQNAVAAGALAADEDEAGESNHDDDDDDAENARRRLEPPSFIWGRSFTFTWRAGGGAQARPAWQVACRLHEKTDSGTMCTRSRTVPEAGAPPDGAASLQTIRVLKHWAVEALSADVHDKVSHQSKPRRFGEDLPLTNEALQERLLRCDQMLRRRRQAEA